MPTTIAYTVPLAQMNKICLQMEKLIADHSKTPFEEKLVPYMKDLIKQLREKDVIITNRQARALYPDYDVPDNDDYLFKNNKQTNLSMFGQRNKFSGLYLPNQYGVNVSYNFMPSLASYAQIHRHRSSDFEMIIPEQFSSVIPDLIKDKPELLREWIKDMGEVSAYFPQGQLIHANMSGSLKNIIGFIGTERACDRAQQETQKIFTHQMLPDIYNG